MASLVAARHDSIKAEIKNDEKCSTANAVRLKERICNNVLRDEDEETDDEDLSLNPNSLVSNISLIFTPTYVEHIWNFINHFYYV